MCDHLSDETRGAEKLLKGAGVTDLDDVANHSRESLVIDVVEWKGEEHVDEHRPDRQGQLVEELSRVKEDHLGQDVDQREGV